MHRKIARHTLSVDLVSEIENELGGLAGVYERLSGPDWKAVDVIVIAHMILADSGEVTDFNALGRRLLSQGICGMRHAVRKSLEKGLFGPSDPVCPAGL